MTKLLIPGTRVKLAKHPASSSTTYWYGTVNRNASDVVWDNERPRHWSPANETRNYNWGLIAE